MAADGVDSLKFFLMERKYITIISIINRIFSVYKRQIIIAINPLLLKSFFCKFMMAYTNINSFINRLGTK